MKIFSYGGGVQSTASLVLAAVGKLEYSTFIFSNVGKNAENPETLIYLEEYARPFAEAHGLELIETAWVGQKGIKKDVHRDLYNDLLDALRSIDIPVRLQSGAFGHRKCTARYKIEPIAKWSAEHGATVDAPAQLGLGISWDELLRMSDSTIAWHVNHYPLVWAKITRADCETIIQAAGLPVPPKSSCWFCPFKHLRDWQELRANNPKLFKKAIDLEILLNHRRLELGLDAIFIGPGMLLTDIPEVTFTQLSLDFEGCDSGHCWS